MADNEEGEETPSRGNEWEVVSLTASGYAAAPGFKQGDLNTEIQDKSSKDNEPETSNAMFMSSHFLFPPSQHENLPLEPENIEIHNEKGSDYDVPQLAAEENEENMNFDNENDKLSVEREVFENSMASIYSTAELSSNTVDGADEETVESLDDELDLVLSSLEKDVEIVEYDGDDLPCGAWWKRGAVSLYSHVKEANTFWSICIAAAVMGVVIIGHRWQQERWQILHLKWQCGGNYEIMGRMLGPISRFKDVIVGGQRRGSLVRGSTSTSR